MRLYYKKSSMKKTILIILFATIITSLHAQRHEVYDPNIKSLQVVAGQNWMSLPIINSEATVPTIF